MRLVGRMFRALLTGPRRWGCTPSWAFSSRLPHLPVAGLLTATELVSHWTAVFEKRGIPEARESSEYIVAHILGAKTFQSLKPELRTQPLSPGQLQSIQELSSCRLQRMPVQYILGEWDFQGLTLKMAPPVFIPRPETEELVEWVLEEVSQRACADPLVLEVGCGSGAISLSLLSQLPQSRVIAVEKEEAAIHLTRENAQRLQLQDRIHIIPLDVTTANESEEVLRNQLLEHPPSLGSVRLTVAFPGCPWVLVPVLVLSHGCGSLGLICPPLLPKEEDCWMQLLPWGPLDLVVSNPPYVFREDMEHLAPEICSYEDPVALDGGEEGMDVIAHILTLASRLLKDSGSIFLEVDPRHPDLVHSWLQRTPDLSLDLIAVRKDFCGRPRFLHIQRSCPVDAWPGPQTVAVHG